MKPRRSMCGVASGDGTASGHRERVPKLWCREVKGVFRVGTLPGPFAPSGMGAYTHGRESLPPAPVLTALALCLGVLVLLGRHRGAAGPPSEGGAARPRRMPDRGGRVCCDLARRPGLLGAPAEGAGAALRPALGAGGAGAGRAFGLVPAAARRHRACACLFALGHPPGPPRTLPPFPLFLAGMALTLAGTDAFLLLLGFELMSLASWALVAADHDEAGEPRGGAAVPDVRGAGRRLPGAGLRPAGRPCRRARLRGDARRPARGLARRGGRLPSAWPAPGPRPGSCRCMPGCRWPIRRRPAMSRR